MNRNFYVYLYVSPMKKGKYCYQNISFLFEPIYIGKGQNERYLEHIKYLKKHTNDHFKKKINRLLKEGFSKQDIENHILIYKDNLTEQEAFDLEAKLIKEIGRSDLKLGPLTNHTNGGDGVSGYIFKSEDRRKISDSKIGKKRSEETKRKISESLMEHVVSEETKNKMRKERSEESKNRMKRNHADFSSEKHPNFGKHLSDETKRKISDSKIGKKRNPFTEGTKQKMRDSWIRRKIRIEIGVKNND